MDKEVVAAQKKIQSEVEQYKSLQKGIKNFTYSKHVCLECGICVGVCRIIAT